MTVEYDSQERWVAVSPSSSSSSSSAVPPQFAWDVRLESWQQMQFSSTTTANYSDADADQHVASGNDGIPVSPLPLTPLAQRAVETWKSHHHRRRRRCWNAVSRIQIQVANQAYSSDSSDMMQTLLEDPSANYGGSDEDTPWASPSGLTVQIEFVTIIKNHDDKYDLVTQQDFVNYLQTLLVDEQWILAGGLRTLSSRRLHRYIQEEDQELDQDSFQTKRRRRIKQQFRVTLPMEAGPAFSAEGMHMWMDHYIPCASNGGLHGTRSPLQWSHWLLSTSETAPQSAMSLSLRRRCLWMDLRLPAYYQYDNESKQNKKLTLSTGIYWRTETPARDSTTTWTDILLGSSSRANMPANAFCPLVRNSTLELIVRTSSEVDDDYNNNSNNNDADEDDSKTKFTTTRHIQDVSFSRNVLEEPIPIAASTAFLPIPTTSWKVYTHLDRPRGPSNGGRFRLILEQERHQPLPPTFCSEVRLQMQQVFPQMLLKPQWRSFRAQYEEKSNDNEWTVISDEATLAPLVQILPQTHGRASQHSHDMMEVSVETTLLIPSSSLSSRIHLWFDYDPSFLPSFEYFPGDANRGVELPPARAKVIVASLPTRFCNATSTTTVRTSKNQDNNELLSTTIYSDSLLIMPPTPDMSMPFNVLSLSSTLVAFCIGAMFNMLLRKGRDKIKYDLYPHLKPKPLLTRIKENFLKRQSQTNAEAEVKKEAAKDPMSRKEKTE